MAVAGIGSAEPDNSINIGGAGIAASDATASMFFVEYEPALSSNVSLLGRLGSMTYNSDDGVYVEDGDVKGINFGMRIYPSGGMRDFYFGGAIGFGSSEWTFTNNKGQLYETQGKGTSDEVRLDLDVGDRFLLGSGPVSLMPSFHLGNVSSIDNTCT